MRRRSAKSVGRWNDRGSRRAAAERGGRPIQFSEQEPGPRGSPHDPQGPGAAFGWNAPECPALVIESIGGPHHDQMTK